LNWAAKCGAAFTITAGSACLWACAGPAVCAVTSAEPEPPAVASADPFRGAGDVFWAGDLPVREIDLKACDFDAPRPMRVFAPTVPGDYAVVLFQHGFVTRSTAYSEMLQRVASHGFVVVAPQMYEPGLSALAGSPSASREADDAIDLIDWMARELTRVSGVTARVDRLGIAGHSRGGKVAWLVAQRRPDRLLAIAGVDPVDGRGGPAGNQSPAVAGTTDLGLPVLVIGAGLGGSCAPAGENHVKFFAASPAPAWHWVLPGIGHADMLDAASSAAATLVCAKGPDSEDAARTIAGLLVAHFRAALQGDSAALDVLNEASGSPIAAVVESR